MRAFHLIEHRAPGVGRRIRAIFHRLPTVSQADGRSPAAESQFDVPRTRPGEWVDRSWDFDPGESDLPWIHRFPFRVDPGLTARPHLNVLVPGLRAQDLSGGPNTVIQVAYRLAARGSAVRFVSTDVPLDDTGDLRRHMGDLTGLPADLPNVDVVSAQAEGGLAIGENDLFLATAWWTAQLARRLIVRTRATRFLYLVQDHETLFFPSSTVSALAEETYALDHVPIVNTNLLLDHLRSAGTGRYREPAFASRALVFEPAVDQRFHRRSAKHAVGHRLLLYARPKNGERNLFELSVAALRLAARRGAFDQGQWELIGIGEQFPDQPIAPHLTLRPHRWLGFEEYAALMGSSDLLVSLMLSPHPSYPPLEMAASGGITVTNSFGIKNAERLAEISPSILVAEPTVEAIADAIVTAARRARTHNTQAGAGVSLPRSWDESLAAVVPAVEAAMDEMREPSGRLDLVWRDTPRSDYDRHRLDRLAARRALYDHAPKPRLFSILTPAWNTDPGFLRVLARSVFEQDEGSGFEWVLVDNGSDRPDTVALLDELSAHPLVRFERLTRNSGIMGGMRACLERAGNEYVVAVDHDDLLSPDALRVVGAVLEQNGYPPLFYTDEDCVDLDVFRRPNHKPGWDPVLFANSCYIAHLSGMRRDLALELGAYTDASAEASPDWDAFTRAVIAGHQPVHVPEVVYSWRVHHESTASGHEAKTTVSDSQRAVVERSLFAMPDRDKFTIEPNPRSPGRNDWWIRRRPEGVKGFVVCIINSATRPANIVARVTDIADETLVQLQAESAKPSDDEWPWEAVGLFERFPDAAAVGGRIVSAGRVIGAAGYFGFGEGWDGPEVGQDVDDFGHLDLTAKQRTVDVIPADLCLVRSDVLRAAARALQERRQGIGLVGPWIGAVARADKRRCIFSPHVLADARSTLDSLVSARDRAEFLHENRDLLATTQNMSPRVDLRAERAYGPVDEETRDAHVAHLLGNSTRR